MKFVIICAARSGSTMLRYLLDSHPDIICHGEVLVGDGLQGLSSKWNLDQEAKIELKEMKRESPVDFFHQLFNSSQFETIGLKYKTDEYFDAKYAGFTEQIESGTSIAVIHLRRKNILAQYISHQRILSRGAPMLELDSKNSWANTLTAKWRNRPFKINKSQVTSYAIDVMNRDEQVAQRLPEHRVHNVWYEDIVTPHSKAMKDLLEFLKVEIRAISTPTLKQTPNHLSLIKNPEIIKDLKQDHRLTDRIW